MTPVKKINETVHPVRVLLDFVPFVLVEPGPVPRPGRPHAGVPLGRRLARHAKGQAARDARQPVLALPVPHHVSALRFLFFCSHLQLTCRAGEKRTSRVIVGRTVVSRADIMLTATRSFNCSKVCQTESFSNIPSSGRKDPN